MKKQATLCIAATPRFLTRQGVFRYYWLHRFFCSYPKIRPGIVNIDLSRSRCFQRLKLSIWKEWDLWTWARTWREFLLNIDFLFFPPWKHALITVWFKSWTPKYWGHEDVFGQCRTWGLVKVSHWIILKHTWNKSTGTLIVSSVSTSKRDDWQFQSCVGQ